MKKIFALLLLGAFFTTVGAEYKFKQIRIDLRAVKDTTFGKVVPGENLYIAVKNPKDADEDLASALVYSQTLTKEWQKLTVSFVPEDDGFIRIAIHTPGARGEIDRISPVWVDDIQVTGGKLANGDFEILKNGKPANWGMGKETKLITGKAAKGNNCVQVFHGTGILGGHIRVTAGEKVTVTLQTRLAE